MMTTALHSLNVQLDSIAMTIYLLQVQARYDKQTRGYRVGELSLALALHDGNPTPIQVEIILSALTAQGFGGWLPDPPFSQEWAAHKAERFFEDARPIQFSEWSIHYDDRSLEDMIDELHCTAHATYRMMYAPPQTRTVQDGQVYKIEME